MRKQVLIFLGLVISSYIASVALTFFLEPAPLANILGFLALSCYIVTLVPSIARTVFPSLKKNQTLIWLLKYRRHIGVAAFSFGLNHGVLLGIERHISLLDPHTYLEYFQGISLMIIFTVLAVTSNDWSVKSLKANWRKLHQITYLGFFLVPWHIIDKMANHWTRLTPIGLLMISVMIVLFTQRKWLEWKQQNEKKANVQKKCLKEA